MFAFLAGLGRIFASVAAFMAGMLEWPLWWMGPIIVVHAIFGHLHSRAVYTEVTARLADQNADAEARERYQTFYSPEPIRDLALAFVRCGIAFAAGWAFAQWGAPPTAKPPVPGS